MQKEIIYKSISNNIISSINQKNFLNKRWTAAYVDYLYIGSYGLTEAIYRLESGVMQKLSIDFNTKL